MSMLPQSFAPPTAASQPKIADATIADLAVVGGTGPNGPFDQFGKLAQFVNTCRSEAMLPRNDHVELHPMCLALYLHGSERSNEPHVYPKIQGMIHAFAELATSTPPNTTLKSGTIMDGGQPIMTTAGESRLLNCNTVVEAYQPIFDNRIQRTRMDTAFFNAVVVQTLIYGWQDCLIDWDELKHLPVPRIIPALQWYKDGTEAELEFSHFVGLDWPIDAQEAKRLYRDVETAIDEHAVRGIYFEAGGAAYSSVFVNQAYARPMITLSHWWLRNHEVALSDQDAIASGLVFSKPVPMENDTDDLDNSESSSDTSKPFPGVGSGDGPDAGGLEAGAAGNPDQSGEEEGESADGEDSLASASPLPPPPREALFLKETGEEIDSDHPRWPRKYVIRHCIEIVGKIVLDEVWDGEIPVASNFNVRIPDRPYGQSECIRVRTIQRDRNTLHTKGIEHAEWQGAPTIIADKALQDESPELAGDQGMRPDKTYYVDRQAMNVPSIKDCFAIIDPPALPAVILQISQELDKAFDDAGGRPDSLKGNVPTANASGVLAQSLYSAAVGQASFRFKYLSDFWYRVSDRVFYKTLRIPPKELARINRTYDEQGWAAIQQMGLDMDWDFGIEIAGGQAKAARDQQTRQDFQLGLIDAETACDKLGYDYKQIQQRRQQAMVAAQPAGVPQQLSGQATQPAAPPPGGSPQSQNPAGANAQVPQ